MITQTTVRHTTVYLVRHGESLLNREKRVSGQLDTSLSSNGIQKGQLLADRLRHVALTGIYTSALTRTVETARPTAEHHGLPIQRTPELNELHMGVLEGRFRDTRDPEASAIWQEHKKINATTAFREENVSSTLRNGSRLHSMTFWPVKMAASS